MPRDYAAVPHEYLEEMSMLGDAEFGRLIRALLHYSRTGEAMALSGNERFYVNRVTAEEDRHRRSYEEKVAACSRAGRASAQARHSTDVDGAKQNEDTDTEPKTEAKNKGLFSSEKKPPRAAARKEKKAGRNDWMNDYD